MEGGWKERREKGREWRVGVKGGREGGRKEGREWRVGVKGGRGGREDSEGGREGRKRRKGGRMEGGRETNYQLTTLCVFGTMVSYHM